MSSSDDNLADLRARMSRLAAGLCPAMNGPQECAGPAMHAGQHYPDLTGVDIADHPQHYWDGPAITPTWPPA